MINFIRRGVSKIVPTQQYELNNAITCSILTTIQEDKPIILNNNEQFDIVVLTKIIRSKFISFSKQRNKELSEMTPLEYAEMYESINGNPLVFLNNYQNYFGPIE